MTHPGRGPSLFRDEQPARYLVDTSAWLNLNGREDSATAWAVVVALINDDRLYSPRRVVDEVVSIRTQIQPYVPKLVRCDRNDEAYLLKVGEIAYRYRRMSKPLGTRTKADPFLVALAILDDYTVVAEESMKNRPVGKIPGVCHREEIRCWTLSKLFACEGLPATRS